MDDKYAALLSKNMDPTSLAKLEALNNEEVMEFVAQAIELCAPAKVAVCDDSAEDVAWIRQQAIDNKEEIPLKIEGHTVHFDGYYDQARKKDVTKYLVPEEETLDAKLNQMPRDEGLGEIEGLQRGSYAGR
ncbi:MAG: phosphoenolpyruvate carboxykinase, partial [Planctomycetota bacterium]